MSRIQKDIQVSYWNLLKNILPGHILFPQPVTEKNMPSQVDKNSLKNSANLALDQTGLKIGNYRF